ncbi:hypothetical protein K2173_024084 [Erythroxylum novogranatense]|uniref:Endopeptidase S2P n=1 Tax=Erythroxylum novogranatense TaxID=1862640 RepID=A0AAV8UC50_9ROSI|nr:hypothetical protein K2173_024084 [Erythroxylum novogranatense]
MEERRARRFGRVQPHPQLPLHRPGRGERRLLSGTVSLWYCDYRISALNGHLLRFGRRYSKFLRLWFSIGVGFALTSLLLVTLILSWELGSALHVFRGNSKLSDLSGSLLFGFSPWVTNLRLSLVDAAYLGLSTLISVSFHEFGHAIAAASEGVQIEYIALFVAVLFPGALIAFSHDSLQALQCFNTLRVYCAGVWHNAVCSAVCGLSLFFLPLILSPFFIYGNGLMVLDISSTSPLSGYLLPGDVIISMDGNNIHTKQEWMQMITLIDEQILGKSNHSENSEDSPVHNNRKGYCVPTAMIAESKKFNLVDDQYTCPGDLLMFVTVYSSDSNRLDDIRIEDGHPKRRIRGHCLNAKEVVRLNKCGDRLMPGITNSSSYSCSLDEFCFGPLQYPGLVWVEITYSSPYSPGCMQHRRNVFSELQTEQLREDECGGSFIFVGDLGSMADSVWLAEYQPRLGFASIAYLPSIMEKSLMCTFHVSLSLALLNSLPVYFLDGESILEVALCHFTSLGPMRRARVLQFCLVGGTVISMLAFMRIFLAIAFS